MLYRVKWIAKIDQEKLGLSEAEYNKKMADFRSGNDPSHTPEQQALREGRDKYLQEEMDNGNLLARGNVMSSDGKEIHTIAIWKSKAAFQAAQEHEHVKGFAKAMVDEHGWIFEKTVLNKEDLPD